jgi:hypothetical protein
MIEETKDPALIKQLATHPSIFRHVSDDYTAIAEAWEPNVTSKLVVNLVARDGEDYFGFGIFIARTWSCYEGHMGFLPQSYGDPAIRAFEEMIEWMWQHTTAARITGEICQENRRAIKFAMRAGFKPYGVNEKSKMLGGVLRDQVCLGISRPSL